MDWMDDSGLHHMDVAHNIIFSIPESTVEGAEGLIGDNLSMGSGGASTMTTGLMVGSASLPADVATDSSTEGRDLGGDTSQTLIPYIVGCTLSAATGGGATKGIIIIFENDRPNSCVEKNAADVYHSLHGENKRVYTYPAVIAESPAGYEAAANVFGSGSLDKAKETLDVWESILEGYVQ